MNTPTPQYAGMVVVPKISDDVKISVHLIESVWKEVHPIPSVGETLGKQTGTTIFSKLETLQ